MTTAPAARTYHQNHVPRAYRIDQAGLPPTNTRAGHILLVDSTNFTTLFGGTDSLSNFWRNLALMKSPPTP